MENKYYKRRALYHASLARMHELNAQETADVKSIHYHQRKRAWHMERAVYYGSFVPQISFAPSISTIAAVQPKKRKRSTKKSPKFSKSKKADSERAEGGNTRVMIDFDGVIHSYTTKFERPEIIPDPPVPGAIEWLEDLDANGFETIIFTARINRETIIDPPHKDEVVRAIRTWLLIHSYNRANSILITDQKFHGHVYIDDRAWRFTGKFPTADELLELKPWYKSNGAFLIKQTIEQAMTYGRLIPQPSVPIQHISTEGQPADKPIEESMHVLVPPPSYYSTITLPDKLAFEIEGKHVLLFGDSLPFTSVTAPTPEIVAPLILPNNLDFVYLA